VGVVGMGSPAGPAPPLLCTLCARNPRLMQLQAGQSVDRYTIEGLVGQGGMAVVYRVRHNDLDSLHALKVLTLHSTSVRERLRLEGRSQARLRHPNIVSVTDLVDVQGAPGLVMELVEGPSLEDMLRSGSVDLQTADQLARGILEGVAEAHQHGLVHRDLKPGNILVDNRSGRLVAKITDFGLVKVVMDDAPQGHNVTRAGTTMGTPAYMAPEQIRDAGAVDARADLFSLGVILYELVCGQPPFVGADMLEVFNRICTGDFTPPTTHAPMLPRRMVDAIQAALVVDRNARVADCRTLLQLWTGEGAGRGPTLVPTSMPPMPDQGSLSPAVQGMETVYGEDVDTPSLAPTPHTSAHNSAETFYAEDLSGDVAPAPVVAPPTVDLADGPAAPRSRPLLVAGLAGGAAIVLLAGLWVAFGQSAETHSGGSMSTWTPTPPKAEEAAPVDATPDAPPEEPPPEAAPAPAPTAAAVSKPTTKKPVKAEPKAEATPKKQPDPAPEAAPTTGHVTLTGIDRAWLVNSSGRHQPGSVPPGTYTVKAFFSGLEPTDAGTIVVEAGARYTLRCSPMLTVCTASRK